MSTQPETTNPPNTGAPNSDPNPPQNPPQNPAPQEPNTQPAPQAPQNPPAERTAQTATDATRNLLDARSLQELRTEIQALPERIVNGIREATQPPRQPAPTNSGGSSENGGSPTGAQPGKRKGFADWWFNG